MVGQVLESPGQRLAKRTRSTAPVTSGAVDAFRRSPPGNTALIGTLVAMDIDPDAWRWFWTVLSVILVVGEIFSPGFFLLPFGIGAGAAAILAWFDVGNTGVHWAVFLVVSIASLLSLRTLIRKQDEGEPDAIGANRYLRKRGLVLEEVDARTGTGFVRIDTEEWRAVTEGDPIPVGTEIIVSGVTGSRLIVQAVDRQPK